MNNRIYYEIYGTPKVTIEDNTAKFDYPCESTTECIPYKVSIFPGRYKFELYGAQGGDSRYQNQLTIRENSGGKGAYASGILNLFNEAAFFFFIGGKGEDQTSTSQSAFGYGGYNGGGNGGADRYDTSGGESNSGGGGATDIRIINSTSIKGLKSRIIVAAGGGSAASSDNYIYQGGAGGGLKGISKTEFVFPGTQTTGLFGRGQNGISIGQVSGYTGGSTGGGGGGYYGGITKSYGELPLTSRHVEVGGAGGSSYISGYPGCNSVRFDKEETETITHTGRSEHYSGYVFRNGIMKSGESSFNKPGSNDIEKGHSGNGFIVVTYIGTPYLCTKERKAHSHISFSTLIFILVVSE